MVDVTAWLGPAVHKLNTVKYTFAFGSIVEQVVRVQRILAILLLGGKFQGLAARWLHVRIFSYLTPVRVQSVVSSLQVYKEKASGDVCVCVLAQPIYTGRVSFNTQIFTWR